MKQSYPLLAQYMAECMASVGALECDDAFALQGCADLYRAAAWTGGRDCLLRIAREGVTQAGEIDGAPGLGSRALFFALEETGEERFARAIEACVRESRTKGAEAQIEYLQRTLPLCMEYEMKRGRMEHVSDVVDLYRKTRSALHEGEPRVRARHLASVAQSMELVSEQLYEHYRALVDLFREGVKSLLPCCGGADELAFMAYALLKGIRMGVLDEERYLPSAKQMLGMLEKTIAGAGEDCMGAVMMAYAEGLRTAQHREG